MTLSDLPPALYLGILSTLPARALARLACTSREDRCACSTDELWSRLFALDFGPKAFGAAAKEPGANKSKLVLPNVEDKCEYWMARYAKVGFWGNVQLAVSEKMRVCMCVRV